MPEQNPPRNDDGGDDKVTLSKADLAQLRAAAERSSQQSEELATLRKQMAFKDAGVDLESEGGKLLFGAVEPGDDGSFDLSSLTERARAVGALAGSSQDSGPPLNPGEDTSADERQQVASGSGPAEAVDPGEDPYEAAAAAYKAVLDNNGRTENAQIAYAETVFAAAEAGDERVFVRSG